MVGGAGAGSVADVLRDVNLDALAAHRAGRSAEALALFDRLIDAAPRLAVLRNNRATILAEVGRDVEARPEFERALALDPDHVDASIGLGALLWRAGETAPALACYRAAASRAPQRLDAHLAIFELGQITGARDLALTHQRAALAIRRLYTTDAAIAPARRRLLVLKQPGDWQANLPLEYVLDGTVNTVHTWYVDAEELAQPRTALPAHDLVINAVSESDEAEPLLAAIAGFAARSAAPLLNRPEGVLRAARHRFPEHLAGIARCLAPVPLRLTRRELEPANLAKRLAAAGISPPFLLRPIASQAGRDLARIEHPDDVAAYLAGVSEDGFYLTQFYDYAAGDGFYRKYRIIFVDGEPFPYHLAISPSWMVHYYNAGMREDAVRRAEEARFLGDLGSAFDPGLQDALRRLAAAIGLDYFGIDCTVTPDNRLLVFEVETGMIVHNLDPVDIYPYKPAAFRRIAEALEAMLARRAVRVAA